MEQFGHGVVRRSSGVLQFEQGRVGLEGVVVEVV